MSAGPDDVQVIEPLSTYDTKGSQLTCMTAVAVNDDRTTTYAESVAGGSDSDSSDEDSDDGLVSEQGTAEAETQQATAPVGRHKFCWLLGIFGMKVLQAFPAVSVTKLEKATIGKLVEMRSGCLEPRKGGDQPYKAISQSPECLKG